MNDEEQEKHCHIVNEKLKTLREAFLKKELTVKEVEEAKDTAQEAVKKISKCMKSIEIDLIYSVKTIIPMYKDGSGHIVDVNEKDFLPPESEQGYLKFFDFCKETGKNIDSLNNNIQPRLKNKIQKYETIFRLYCNLERYRETAEEFIKEIEKDLSPAKNSPTDVGTGIDDILKEDEKNKEKALKLLVVQHELKSLGKDEYRVAKSVRGVRDALISLKETGEIKIRDDIDDFMGINIKGKDGKDIFDGIRIEKSKSVQEALKWLVEQHELELLGKDEYRIIKSEMSVTNALKERNKTFKNKISDIDSFITKDLKKRLKNDESIPTF